MPGMAIVRGNQGTVPTAQMGDGHYIPQDIQDVVDSLIPVVRAFRNNSSPQQIMLDEQPIKVGSTTTFRVSSTGLGEQLYYKFSGTISLQNTAGTSQVVNLSPEFPYNVVTTINTQINGNTSISNASPMAYLLEIARRKRNFNLNPLSSRVCKVTAGAGATLNMGTPSLSGYTSVTVAANTTATINFTCYLLVPYTLNRTTMFGLLPLQNSSTYATVTFTGAPTMIGSDQSSPLYVTGGAPTTLSYKSDASTMKVLGRYDFWTVPADPGLYQEMIMNSFQIIEQPANTFQSTGPNALKFQFPLNSLMLATVLKIRDANNAIVNIDNVVQNLRLEYNSNITPFKSDIGIHQFDQFLHTANADYAPLGLIMWDGTATSDLPNISDDTAWMDLYNTSNPAIIADIVTGSITLPATYSFIRTQLVPSDVKVIPG